MSWNPGAKSASIPRPPNSFNGPIPMGAPVATNPGVLQRGYRDGWDINRAYKDGYARTVWVASGIDAIASNQARLPMILRKNRDHESEIITTNGKLLDLLNGTTNMGENSFNFRKRLSTQLLLSSRGSFIEVVRNRVGDPTALQLLPPAYTTPVPDPKTFVSAYQLWLPSGQIQFIDPKNVLWIRNSHPLDPYLSITPLEAAGIAIEIETLAKLYNRNFLLNDGRPGGLIVVQGEMDDDDKQELRSRFRGDLWKTGQVSVIASDGPAQFIDTAAKPRDAAYVEMRSITKAEILAALKVPESLLGNASESSFANAAEELRVFWMETMLPHLEMIARGMDPLDAQNYLDFDYSQVPILVLSKQEREKYMMEEVQTGLRSANEYRVDTGKSRIDSDLADSLLVNPNLTPIGNTEKKMVVPKAISAPGTPISAPAAALSPPAAPGAPIGPGKPVPPPKPPSSPTDGESGFGGVNKDDLDDISTKSEEVDEFATKSGQVLDRMEEILYRTLERFGERQQRVVLQKAQGPKCLKALSAGTLEAGQLFDVNGWNKQLSDDARPVLAAIAQESSGLVVDQTGTSFDDKNSADLRKSLDAQIERLLKVNHTTLREVEGAVLTALAVKEVSERTGMLAAGLGAIFAALIGKRSRDTAEIETTAASNAGIFHAVLETGQLLKVWHTRGDDRVRHAHRELEGKAVPILDGFAVEGAVLRFPGDPIAPPNLSLGCRCRLSFRQSH